MNITEIQEVVARYNSVLNSILGGIKHALETHPDDPSQAKIQKELKDMLTATQNQIAGIDEQIVQMSDELMQLAANVTPLVKLGEEIAESLKAKETEDQA